MNYPYPIVCPTCHESHPYFYAETCFKAIRESMGREMEEEARLRQREVEHEQRKADATS